MRRVALVIAKRDGLVLFGKRRDNGKYTLPGGHLNEGEAPEAGARRELKEETGLKPVGELKLVDERELRDVKFFTFECEVDGAPSGKHDPDQECGVWAFFDASKGIPKDVAENMAGPKDQDKNIALGLMGLAKAETRMCDNKCGNAVDPSDPDSKTYQQGKYMFCGDCGRKSNAKAAARAAAPKWHLTHKENFEINPNYRPQWAYGTGKEASKPSLFVTDQPRYWRTWMNPQKPLYAVRVQPSAAARDLSTKTMHPEWLDEDPANAKVLERLPISDAVAKYPDDFGDDGAWDEWTKKSELAKREQDDEIDRMLMHPNPAERSMALKLQGVQDKHLVRAFADEDPGIQKQALHHGNLGADALLHLMQMPNREHLQQLALQHPAIDRAHLEALYHTHKGRPAHESAPIMSAISNHGSLDSSLIERMVADGHGHGVIENLNTPAHVIESLIEQHQLNPSDPKKRALARRALKHPHAPAHLVEHSFKNGPTDVKIAVAQSQHMPEHVAQDYLQQGHLPAGDGDALLRTFIVSNPKATDRHLKTALHDRNPIVRHTARQKTGTFSDYQSEFNKFFGHAMQKAVRAEDFRAIKGALDPRGASIVDHKPDLEAHPPQHNADVGAYKQVILNSTEPVKRTAGKIATNANITRKNIYTVPAHHPTHGGVRFMVKPYHERISKRLTSWQKHPHQGWAEMTNQALYHAGGIGHLHQNVHVVEHHMGEGHEAEPALVVKMDQGVKSLSHYPHGSMYVPENTKFDARRIALMDFLSNNLDRHAGNIMAGDFKPHEEPSVAAAGVSVPHKLLALDHSRSFQYVNTHEFKGKKRRDQPRQLEDAFGPYASNYTRGSALKYLAPVENPYNRQDPHAWATQWGPVFDWWGEHSDSIRAAMNKRLDQIKDPEVRKHIKRNFDARADWLDERANIGIENYGDDWYKHPVPQYRPGEKTDQEIEHERWLAENPEYA